jgi:hypothetical protein
MLTRRAPALRFLFPVALTASLAPLPAAARQLATTGQEKTAQASAPPPQAVTVRIDLTVSDQVGTQAPAKKTITVIAADGERALVRSTNRTLVTTGTFRSSPTAQFSVDAAPTLVQDKIRLQLTINYDLPDVAGAGQTDGDPAWSTNLQESLGVILEPGKPLIVSQSADPRTDRKVTVEVKATILR